MTAGNKNQSPSQSEPQPSTADVQPEMTSDSLLGRLHRKLTRRKPVDLADTSGLKRCLNTVDLAFIGIGATLGGVHVVTGVVAKEESGPGVVLSYTIDAIIVFLSALCFAEFGTRIPKAGGVYIWAYATLGEFIGFMTGWNLIMLYTINVSSFARAISGYVDDICGRVVSTYLHRAMPIDIPHLSPYPDFIAFIITVILTIILCAGAKESTLFNNGFAIVNVVVCLFAIIAGSFKANTDNWSIPESQVADIPDAGSGGFFPFGIHGIIFGTARGMFAYIGFDSIASTGEECSNPSKAIPRGILICCFLSSFINIAMAATYTLMSPYYLIDTKAPLQNIFVAAGWPWARHIIDVGVLCALATSLLSEIFPLPRIIASIAQDGLLFKNCGKIHSRLQTPLFASLSTGMVAAVMAMLFDINSLVDMCAMGAFLTYSIIPVCVIVCRFQTDSDRDVLSGTGSEEREMLRGEDYDIIEGKEVEAPPDEETEKLSRALQSCTQRRRQDSQTMVYVCGSVLAVCTIAFAFIFDTYEHLLIDGNRWVSGMLFGIGAMIVLCSLVLWRKQLPQNNVGFKTPLVPFVPVLAIQMNLILLLRMRVLTWVKLLVWLGLGVIMYAVYGARHSKLDKDKEEEEEIVEMDMAAVPSYGAALYRPDK